MTSCFVYKVIRDLYSIDHLCINPILRLGLIHKLSIAGEVYKLVVYLAIVNKVLCHSWLARQFIGHHVVKM